MEHKDRPGAFLSWGGQGRSGVTYPPWLAVPDLENHIPALDVRESAGPASWWILVNLFPDVLTSPFSLNINKNSTLWASTRRKCFWLADYDRFSWGKLQWLMMRILLLFRRSNVRLNCFQLLWMSKTHFLQPIFLCLFPLFFQIINNSRVVHKETRERMWRMPVHSRPCGQYCWRDRAI